MQKAKTSQECHENKMGLDFSSPGNTLLSLTQRLGEEGFFRPHKEGPFRATGSLAAPAQAVQMLPGAPSPVDG